MTKRCTLIIDDDPLITQAIKRLLRSEDIEIIGVTGTDAAREVLQSRPVDLVVTDYWLGDENGVEFLQWLRFAHPQTERVLMSGLPTLQMALDAVNQAQAKMVFTKPLSARKLKAVIVGLAQHNHALAELEMDYPGISSTVDD